MKRCQFARFRRTQAGGRPQTGNMLGDPCSRAVRAGASTGVPYTLAMLAALVTVALVISGCSDSPQSAVPATAAGGRPSAAVQIPVGNKQVMAASFGARGPNAVALVADAGRTVDAWGGLPQDLGAAGYWVLALDRAAGTPATDLVTAAVAYLQGQGAERVVLVGEGLAGAAAITAIGEAHGVVALSAPLLGQDGSRRVDTLAGAAGLTRPLLVMAALGDTEAAVNARKIYDAAPEPRTLAAAPGNAKGAALLLGESGIEARRVLLDFLRQAFTPLSA